MCGCWYNSTVYSHVKHFSLIQGHWIVVLNLLCVVPVSFCVLGTLNSSVVFMSAGYQQSSTDIVIRASPRDYHSYKHCKGQLNYYKMDHLSRPSPVNPNQNPIVWYNKFLNTFFAIPPNSRWFSVRWSNFSDKIHTHSHTAWPLIDNVREPFLFPKNPW